MNETELIAAEILARRAVAIECGPIAKALLTPEEDTPEMQRRIDNLIARVLVRPDCNPPGYEELLVAFAETLIETLREETT